LNCGGPGTEAYGPICLRITKGSLDTNPSAVFPSDSLQRYTNDLNEIDTDRIMGEIGCSSSKGNVALIEYQTHSSILDQERWSGIVCSDERYLEITVIGPLSLDNIVELRIRSEYAEEIDKLIDKEIAGEKIEPYERTQVLAISALRAWTNVEITVL
jgi:hypothetical protein